jgi:2-phosphoglycerate kinase
MFVKDTGSVANSEVILVGGAPGVGKTTLGRALAARIGGTSLTVDDLLTAIQAVTTPETHPGLHVMNRIDSIEYFTTSSVAQLIEDASLQHEATWPAIEKLIRKRAKLGPRIVIDGWALRPNKVAALGVENVMSFWLVADRKVFEECERANVGYFGQSGHSERMLQNFLDRTLWYNDLIEQQASQLGLDILRQDGHRSVDVLCSEAMERLKVK